MRRAVSVAGIVSILLLPATLALERADAAIIKGDLVFADNAFADVAHIVNAINGNPTPFGAATVEAALTGDDLARWINDFNTGEIIELGFTAYQVENGPGPDLAVFEFGAANRFGVAAFQNGHTFPTAYVTYDPVSAGVIDGYPMNVARVNLTDLGLPDGAVVTWILIESYDQNGAEIAGVGALNGSPEPATLALLAAGAGAALARRRCGQITGPR